ncbi:monooxygenase [Salinisphaera shabanensis T35B1]|uniref:cytochrome P450 n=1 Tax=Salinisphaera shabanensis TaxID=180542 RepID=UPI00333F25CA
MSSSLSDIACPTDARGPSADFDVAPDEATRRMLVRWHDVYGPVYRIPAPQGNARHWVIHEPEFVQQIMVRRAARYAKGMGLDRVRLLLGEGIMVSEGDFWARQRRLLQPAFKPRRLADFNAMIAAENADLAQRWAEAARIDAPVDVAAHISELTLVIVLKSIFGEDYPRLVDGAANPFSLLSEEATRDLRFAARFHRLGRVVESIIEARTESSPERFDFLGHMLTARGRDGTGMSRRELVDEVMTLIVAGHETTASALAWAWYEIATHPEVCARAQAEVDALAEHEIADVVDHASDRLCFIEAVIHETLRLYPPGWLLSRRAIQADTLGDYEIAADDQIFISPYVLHRDAAYWSMPDRFRPTRFLQAGVPSQRFAYIPFAAGPRHCVGEHLAMTEMRQHLVTMLRRFTPVYAGDHPPKLESRINLRPGDGVPIRWRARKERS